MIMFLERLSCIFTLSTTLDQHTFRCTHFAMGTTKRMLIALESIAKCEKNTECPCIPLTAFCYRPNRPDTSLFERPSAQSKTI